MKHSKAFSQNEVKALLSKLKTSQEEYPGDLLAIRRNMFLVQVPAAGIFLANKAILTTILHGMHASAAMLIKMVLLSVMGVTVTGTMLVAGNNPRFIQFIKDGVKSVQTRVAPTQLVAPAGPSNPVITISPSDLVETSTPTQMPTPTFLATSSLTPTAVEINPTKTPESQPTRMPDIQPTKTSKGDNGNHFGQTKTPRPKKP